MTATADQPDESLLNRLAAAFTAGDSAGALALLRENAVTDHDFCGSVLMSAIDADAGQVVRYVFEEAKMQLSPESCMLLLLDACKKDKPDIAAYLGERCFDAGAARLDAYTVMLEHFTPATHEALAVKAATQASDRQDALDSFMQATAAARKFEALEAVIDLGADVNAGGGKVLTALAAAPPESMKEDREKYLGLIDKFLSAGYHPDLYLDTLFIASALLSTGGLQFAEVPELLLRHGADPWYDRNSSWQALPAKARENGNPEEAARLEEVFTAAKGNMTKNAAHVFDTLFGDDFRIADLRGIAIGGTTGFMLAAQARRLDRVIAAAIREGAGALMPEDLLYRTENQLSALSRALDRGDQAQLLDIRYWQKSMPQLLAALDAGLDVNEKARVDLPHVKAAFDQYLLKAGAARYKLLPG